LTIEGAIAMREPAFTEVMQIGIVVRDLEATVRRYEDDYGIGPWEVAQIDLGDANDYREYGQPVERSNRVAFATVGQVMWELIEPLDEDGIYARFLAERGGGIHHVAVATPNFDETVAQAGRENRLILSGEFSGARVAFLPTERDLGVILEVFSGMPESEPEPDVT
jgi:methylmalonyl-CoA/ethylmalonyl-CoA epimerase